MNALAAIAVGVLGAAGIYLLLARSLQRAAIGFVLFGNAVNLLVLVATPVRPAARPPLLHAATPETIADPLPQAFILTAIVIGLGLTAFLVALLVRARRDGVEEGTS